VKNDLLVTSVLFTPLIGLLPLLLWRNAQQIKWVALAISIIAFGASLLLIVSFDSKQSGLQHEHLVQWAAFGSFRISYYVAIDGLSLWLVILTTLIMPLAILFSFNTVRERIRLYYAFLLVLEFAMIGVFVAQDLFIFYLFWEISLVPMYFIIGIWGAEQRIYAAVKFFVYTLVGSLLMLLAILWMSNHFGTSNVYDILQAVRAAPVSIYPSALTEGLLFLGFFIAFAIKVPLWPFHSWLPDAHVQAPTAGSVILAGVMLKLGTYGLLRFCVPLFPHAAIAFAPYIAVLAIIGIIYGAWVSYAQTDAKKLVAYSSISHLGFVVLGIFTLNAAGMSGAVLQMVNHGISTGGLFLLVGVLYERRHTKALDAFGGIWKVLPVFSGLSLVIMLSSVGLPGLNGFVGEFSILLGTFGSTFLGGAAAAFAALGVILAAVYLFKFWQHIFMGDVKWQENLHLPPLGWNEYTVLVVVVVAAIGIGLYPRPFFSTMDASVNAVQTQIQQVAAANPNSAPIQTAQLPTALK